MSLTLLLKFWREGIILALLVSCWSLSEYAKYYKGKYAEAQAAYVQLAVTVKQEAAQAKSQKDVADAQLQSSVAANGYLGDALRDRVRDYQSARDRALQSAPQCDRPGAVARDPEPVPEAIDFGPAIAECVRNTARLENAHEWSEGLK